ncbi:beta strand repeat-containing protein, partial [Oceanibaculum pacificum]|uniref:beta strand repeat-containing protein n=1 Tax=Oceanibaculum pacificum TaxID=580166 RepID=UPI0012ECCF6C
DGDGGTVTRTVNVTVNAVNDAPTASSTSITTNEDTAGTVDLFALAGDIDSDLDFNSITVTQPAEGGAVVYNAATGVATFTPTANWNGATSFTYTVNDGDGGTVTRTVNVTVNAVNDAPTASNTTITTNEDTAGTVDLLDLAADVDNVLTGANITVGDATNGTVVYDDDTGVVTYTPDADWNGSDSFTYTVDDGDGGTVTRTVNVTVNAVNDAPTASDTTLTTNEDTPGTVDLFDLAADIDSDLDFTSITVGAATNGTVSYDSDTGVVTYTPDANWNGSDSFTYTVDDGDGGTVTRTVNVTVNAVNDAPTGANNTLTTAEDTPLGFAGADFGFTDIDAGDSLSAVRIDSLPANGTLTLDGVEVEAGDIVLTADLADLAFTPNANWNGSTGFTFSVRDSAGAFDPAPKTMDIAVTAVNDNPTASDTTITTNEDTAGTVDLFDLVADIDSALDFTSITVGAATNGTVSYDSDTGVVTYTPDANWNGSDSFTYTVDDGDGGSITRTVNVTVNAVNDAPTASDTTITTNEDTPGTVDLFDLVADIDSALDFTSITVGAATNGTVSYDSDTGVVTYTPDANWNGSDSFTYTVDDGDGGSITRTVNVTVNAVNDAPTASDTTITTNEDTPGTVDLFDLVADIDSALDFTSISVGAATNGTVSYDSDTGVVTYTPDANWNGSDSFTYTVDDGDGGTVTRTVNVTVNAVNDAPTASDTTITTNEDTPGTVDLFDLAADIDSDLDFTSITVGAATNGTVSYDSDTGIVTYTPNANWNGSDSFTYTVDDGDGGSITRTVNVTVNAVNDAPVGADNTITIDEDATHAFTVADFGFTDVDAGDSLSAIRIDSLPANGALLLNGAAVQTGDVVFAADIPNLTFTPDPDWNGGAPFAFSVRDGASVFSAAPSILTLDVRAVNDAPVAAAGDLSTDEDLIVGIDLLALVSDTDNALDGHAITVAQPAAGGSVRYDPDSGTAMFTPDADWNGDTSFTYTVDDGAGGVATNLVRVSVESINDAPTGQDSDFTVESGTALTFAAADFGFADADAGDAMSAIRIDALPDHAALMLDGVRIVSGQIIAAERIADLSLMADAGWSGQTALTFSVRDSEGAFANSANAITVRVTPAPSQPVSFPPVLEEWNTPRDSLIARQSAKDDTSTVGAQQSDEAGTAIPTVETKARVIRLPAGLGTVLEEWKPPFRSSNYYLNLLKATEGDVMAIALERQSDIVAELLEGTALSLRVPLPSVFEASEVQSDDGQILNELAPGAGDDAADEVIGKEASETTDNPDEPKPILARFTGFMDQLAQEQARLKADGKAFANITAESE